MLCWNPDLLILKFRFFSLNHAVLSSKDNRRGTLWSKNSWRHLSTSEQ